MIPVFILHLWLLALLSLGIAGAGIYLAHEWQQRSWGWDPVLQRSIFAPNWGSSEDVALFCGALALIFLALAGKSFIRLALWATGSMKAESSRREFGIEPPEPRSTTRLERSDGTCLSIRFYGRAEHPTLVLAHGWGLRGAEWNDIVRELHHDFQMVVYDAAGLGASSRPLNRDFSLPKLASDLAAVVELTGDRPVTLAGHSIGGMTILTLCRLYPQLLGHKINGLVLTHTTPTNPVRTTAGAAFFTAIEKPVLVPLMYLTILLSPLLWVLNWLAYWNGTAHLNTKLGSFAGKESWDQIESVTLMQAQASPAVLARGMLGMMNYDASSILQGITVPALVVAADKDSTTKPEASRVMDEKIPRSSLATLAPAKHLGLMEHSREYARMVRDFAHRTTSASAATSERGISRDADSVLAKASTTSP